MLDVEVKGKVAVITLNRPKVNALSTDLVVALDKALDSLVADSRWQVLHIRSQQRFFSAGADIEEMYSISQSSDQLDLMSTYVEKIQAVFQRLEDLKQVTVAEISGAALGGGLELALSCDFRIVAEEANIGLPELKIGLLPAGGGTQRLTRRCGRSTAMRLILTSEVVTGKQACELGIAQWAEPAVSLPEFAGRLVGKLCEATPDSLYAAKQCILAAEAASDDGFAAETQQAVALLGTRETQARLSAFLSRR